MLVKSPPGRNRPFEDLLQDLSESSHRNILLKTIHTSGYFTNGTILTCMNQNEKLLIDKMHLDAVATDSEYRSVESLNIKKAIPKFLRIHCSQTKILKSNDRLELVRIEGEDHRVLLEKNAYSLFYHRIQYLIGGRDMNFDTSWWLSKQDGPIVVLDVGSFNKGRLLGTIAPFQLEEESVDFGPPKMERISVSDSYKYRKIDCEV